MTKTIYVVGGTNGVGKSTIRKDLLDASVPYINADFIAKEMKGGQSSLMLAELAGEYGSTQMKKYISAGESLLLKTICTKRKLINGCNKCSGRATGSKSSTLDLTIYRPLPGGSRNG